MPDRDAGHEQTATGVLAVGRAVSQRRAPGRGRVARVVRTAAQPHLRSLTELWGCLLNVKMRVGTARRSA